MRIASILLLSAVFVAAPAAAQRSTLGIYGLWGAFQEPGRCWAVAEPVGGTGGGEEADAFASVGHWPARRLSGQVHVRLSREKRQGSAVLLRIDGRTFQLAGSGRDAWAPDSGADAEIVAAMRTGLDMAVETRSVRGGLIRDRYRLRGAASAIDAAALGCIRR